MYSTRLSKADLKPLLRETMARLPHMNFDKEFQEATLEDWLEDAVPVGLARFTDGVKRARSYTEFFPHRSLIRDMIPETPRSNEKFWKELRSLEARKAAGEKFYNLADVFMEFVRRVETGEFKSNNARGQKTLESWATTLRGQEKAFAAKMLADSDKKRPKSDLERISELAEQKQEILGR